MSVFLVCAAIAMSSSQVGSPIRLWSGDAPGALGQKDDDIPTLTPFLADQPNGTAVVILPGGGYGALADHEGSNYARFLNTLGISGFVLKYRLGSHGYHDPVERQDAARAMRLVRSRAAEWKLRPDRVGIMGSSAGGHLASTILTHFDAGKPGDADPIEQQSSRPDFGILCYAVISMGPYGHAGSRENLLGKHPTEMQIVDLSNETRVTEQTPPCFIWHTVADDVVPVENSMMFAQALRAHHVPFDLHLYQKGGHGLGLGDGPPFAKVLPWAHDLTFWLRANGWIS
jgi:acetyl esterase/lipase